MSQLEQYSSIHIDFETAQVLFCMLSLTELYLRVRKLKLNVICDFQSKFNHLRLYGIRTIRNGRRKIQLSKASQCNSININQVHLLSKKLHYVWRG